MKPVVFSIIFIFLLQPVLFAQDEESGNDSTEVFIIDSYVTPEQPNKFILSFFTDRPAKSKVVLQGKYDYPVSTEYKEDHKIEIDVSKLQFDSLRVPFIVYVEDTTGKTTSSEKLDVALPSDFKSEASRNPNIFLMCCVGGVIFGLPSPTYVSWGPEKYFSLTKEIPLLSFHKFEKQYPFGFISVEYSYIFDAPTRNFFRAGYKHIFEVPYLEYISPGISTFSNFKGFNGLSPELTIGIIKFYDVFTIFTKYRYNFKPSAKNAEFHEISIGLYSSFFSLNLSF